MKYIKQNEKEFEILNILEWHKKGYTGKGVKVVNLESTYPASFFRDKIKLTFPYNYSDKVNKHGQKTLDVINQVAPNAELYPLSNGTDKFENDTIPFILEENIHLVNASLGGSMDDERELLIKECLNNGSIFTTSAGNTGNNNMGAYALSSLWLAVGAVHYSDKYNNIYKADYSSTGKDVFVTSFSNLWLRHGEYDKLIPSQQGTSFSSPLFCGMLALVQQFFIEKTGEPLNKDIMVKFITDHVVDLGVIGKDEKYGYGLFVLPDPDKIEVDKYLLKDNNNIKNKNEVNDDMKFKDVSNNKWSEKAIDVITDLGLMKGFNDGTFRPEDEITREQMAQVLYNLYMKGYIQKF